ncbi:MAG: hypothetical protein PF488_04730 [Patescibacteria group bacterium]|jgi:hypothetical protein|nr:hypothetical protein [Patescibacteria group bacterium]
MMINPNNLKDLAESLSDSINRLVPEQQLERLSEKQRNFLTTLLWLDQTSQATRDGKHPIAVIKDMLNMSDSKHSEKTSFYLKQKLQ